MQRKVVSSSALGRVTGRVVVAVIGVLAIATADARGDTLNWTGAQSSAWSNPQNWSPAGLPGAADLAAITNGGTVSLNDLEASVSAIRLGPPTGSTTGGGGTLNVSAAAAGLTTQGAFIADGAMSTGTVNVSNLATWNDTGFGFAIGARGVGRVEITASGELTRDSDTTFFDYSLFLGDHPGSEGTLIVDQGKFTHKGGRGVIVGDEGRGTVEIRQDSTAINDGHLEIGRQAGSDGAMTVNHSTWTNTLDVNVGFLGVGTLTLKNDAVFSARSSNVAAASMATVDHAAWNNTAFFGSQGTLEVKQGGVISANQLSVSAGLTTVTESYLIAEESLTVRGTGVLNLNSGVIHVSDQLFTPAGTGVLIGNRTGLGRLLVESGGALRLPANGGAVVDGLEGTQATVTGAGSRWNVDRMNVGDFARGQMFITAGGEAAAAGAGGLQFIIGVEPTADGEVSVTGKSPGGVPSRLSTTNLIVGNKGRGRLTISGGATVSSTTAAVGNLVSPNFDGGEATVTGAGSEWSVSSQLFVGNENTGKLTINGGGRVAVGSSPTSSSVIVGRAAGLLPGTVVVEGANSKLNVLGSLTVGDRGVGEMQIKSAGHVENDAAWIGYDLGSQGRVLVDGGTWLTRDLLSVGLAGTAELDIRNGGVVVAKNDVVIGSLGTVLGTGGITGDGVTVLVENSGTVMPGASPGTFTITGNYKQHPVGKLQIELASPTSYDVLNVSGSAMLGGTLDVVLTGGYTPGPGDSFEFLKASSFSGAFSSVTVRTPTGPAGSFSLLPTPTGLSLANYQGGGGPPTSGLIAYWNAENGAVDVTGNGHDGAFQGNAATAVAGPFGKAFTFDGAGDYITIGDELDMGASDFTLSAWINGDPSMNQWARIFDKGYFTAYSLHRRGIDNQIGFEGLNSGNFFGTTTPLIDNSWHHVTLVKSGTTVTIYADGVAEGSNFISGAPQDNGLPLLIGFNPGEGTQGFWKGLLDELKIFNRALTPAEVAALALAPGGGDFDVDGDVDGNDFLEWQRGLGSTRTAADLTRWRAAFPDAGLGDFDGNGQVDGADFLRWQRGGSPGPMSSADLARWKATFAAAATPAVGFVPEPAGLTTVAIAAISLTLRVRRTKCERGSKRGRSHVYTAPSLRSDSRDSLSERFGGRARVRSDRRRGFVRDVT